MTDGFMSIQLKHSHLYANMTDDRRNRISQKMHFLSKRLPFPYKTLPVSIQNATAADIKAYFEANRHAVEVLLFKGKKAISVNRYVAQSPMFYRQFRKKYEQ
jgi:hypothetical protein